MIALTPDAQHDFESLDRDRTSLPTRLDDVDASFRGALWKLPWTPERSSKHGSVIGVSSCHPGQGVTTVAANLAIAAALAGSERVGLVDANFANPAIHAMFDGAAGPGLADIVTRGAVDASPILSTHLPNLSVVPAGSHRGRHEFGPTRAGGFRSFFRVMSSECTFTVVDLPAARDLGSSGTLLNCLDGVVLVVEAETVRDETARQAKAVFERAGGRLLGVIVNKRPDHIPDWLYDRI